MHEAAVSGTGPCVTCGQPFEGRYCPACGEKRLHDGDRHLLHFFEEFFHGLTHADNKFLRSLWYLLTRPGFLTVEYLRGRRKPYTALLSLFLIGNLLYFLVPTADTVNTRYGEQVRSQNYSARIQPVAARKMAQRHWTEEQLAGHYNAESGKVSKLLLIGLIFGISLPVTVLFYSRRRYYFEHLMFSTEYICFILYGLFLLLPLLLASVQGSVGLVTGHDLAFNENGDVFLAVLLLLLTVFLTAAIRRVYRQGWPLAVCKALVLAVATGAVIIGYRFLLFYATMAML